MVWIPGFMEELKRRDLKIKTLVTLALDAAGSHPEGARALLARARSRAATEGR